MKAMFNIIYIFHRDFKMSEHKEAVTSGLVAFACDPNSGELVTEECHEFEASLGYLCRKCPAKWDYRERVWLKKEWREPSP